MNCRLLAATAGLLGALLTTSVIPGQAEPTLKLPDIAPAPGSLQDYHVTRESGRLFLRFGAGIVNVGDGALEVTGKRDGPGDRMPAYQVIYRRGSSPDRRRIGSFEWHPTHHHWHVLAVARYRLLDASGGDVADGEKVSFCLVDEKLVFPNLRGSPSRFVYGYCPEGRNRRSIRQGISVGWRDFYPSQRDGQEIDITNVPPGDYTLQTEVNPDGIVQEKTRQNNTASIEVSL